MISNFPISIFHRLPDKVPTRPTFGARLSRNRQSYSETGTLMGMSGGMVNTMRQVFDYDTILKHPDYKHLICNIDADREFNWLNFGMGEDKKIALFVRGAEKAMEFLQKFDWEAYLQIRGVMGKAS
jgi:NTE family protein